MSGFATRRCWKPAAAVAGCVVVLFLSGCSGSTPKTAARSPDPGAMRRLSIGVVAGTLDGDDTYAWLGLPYAQPPVGTRRFHAPAPRATESGVRPAIAPGSPCLQYGWSLGGVGRDGAREGSEDCLYLNVYAPRMTADEAADARLPVMVWVHGGSNTVGTGSTYEGRVLSRTGRVVVVTLNYRLGPFGWFVMPHGGRGGGGALDPFEASGNFGLLDLLEALRFVRDNARAFGGDPSNVTLMGESAGATDALALAVSPLAEGLFHRLVIESLGFPFASIERASHYLDDPVPGGEWSSAEILLKALVQSGRAADRAAAKRLVGELTDEEVAEFLRSLDPWQLYSAYDPSNLETDRFPTVFADGTVVRRGAAEALLADPARHQAVPTLIGTNRDESKLFMAFDPRLVTLIAGMPVRIRDRDGYEREARYRSLLWKATGVDALAEALTQGGTPVYVYRFDWSEEGRRFGVLDLSTLVGAAHGLEIPFVFGAFEIGSAANLLFTPKNAAGRRALSDAMRSYWVEFARTGQPGHGTSGDLPLWPRWSAQADAERMLVLDTAAHGGVRPSTEWVRREDVIERMQQAEPAGPAACAMFRATFPKRVDPIADADWQRFHGGYCTHHPEGARRREAG